MTVTKQVEIFTSSDIEESKKGKKTLSEAQINAFAFAQGAVLEAGNIALQSSQTNAKALSACQDQMSVENNMQEQENFLLPDKSGKYLQSYTTQVDLQMGQGVVNGKAGFYNFYELNGVCYTIGGKDQIKVDKVIRPPYGMHGWGVLSVKAKHMVTMDSHAFGELQLDDQKIEKDRQYLSNKIMILQQASQPLETNISTKESFVAQFLQLMTNMCSWQTTFANNIAQMKSNH